MDLWAGLLDILILLAAAIVLGALCERFRQSPLIGYLLAGALLGPNALDLLPSHEAVTAIAELGIALLLFTIGLEFSWRRLRDIGSVALAGGTLQVVLTATLTAGICLAVGLSPATSVAFGAVVALSSTAAVLQLLAARVRGGHSALAGPRSRSAHPPDSGHQHRGVDCRGQSWHSPIRWDGNGPRRCSPRADQLRATGIPRCQSRPEVRRPADPSRGRHSSGSSLVVA